MIRTEMWSFSYTQVLFIGVSQAHRESTSACELASAATAH